MKALKKYRWPLTGALLGALVFLAVYGVRVLDPTSVDWILNNPSPDPAQHYLGWELFRRSPVHLPYIGANYNAVYPFRTSVLFTDSLPLAALFFKLLGGVLPARFQYFGWWGLACYMLQGGLAQAVIARIAGVQPTVDRSGSKAAIGVIISPQQTAKLWGSAAGAGLLVLFPALTMRMFAHTALAANWLVLLALYLWLRSDELMPTTRRACLVWAGMGLLCAGIHLYYLPMVGLVLVGYAVRRALQKRGPAAVLAPIAAFCAAALAELVLLGAFAVNFAGYSNGYLSGADYFGLFVPWLAQSWEQNVYAGIGTSLAVVLAVFGIVCNARKAEKFFAAHRDWLIAGAVVLVLDLIAAGGNAITVNGKTLFTVPIPQFLMNFWAMFSSCARLAWLAGMLLAAVGCGLVLRFWDNGVAPALMLAVCAVAQGWGQRSELFNRWTDYHYYGFRYENKTLLTDPVWEQIAADLADVLPSSMDLTGDDLKSTYGIDPADLEDYVCKLPMMSAHITEFFIAKVKDGKMDVHRKYRGKMNAVLCEYVRERLKEVSDVELDRIFITASSASDETVEAVRKTILECYPFKEILFTTAGCTVASHCGPGCLGILFFTK